MPSLHEIVSDEKKMVEIQDLSIDDILPRSRVFVECCTEVKCRGSNNQEIPACDDLA